MQNTSYSVTGKAVSVILYLLSLAELIASFVYGSKIISSARIPAESTPYGAIGGGVNPLVQTVGIAIIVAGIVSAIVLASIGYVCSALAELHRTDPATTAKEPQ